MTEYRLEKKTLGGWTQVSWWQENEQDKAKASYDACINQKGYAWRLVKVDVIAEQRLEEEVEITNVAVNSEQFSKSDWATDADKAKANVWGGQSQNKNSEWGAIPAADGWGTAISDNPKPAGVINSVDGRGAKAGSICLIHHVNKKRMRAMPNELDVLLSQGWEKGGPRTAFRI